MPRKIETPKFGTSGLRGLAAELTDQVIADHTRAFLAACPHGGAVHVGQDLRGSSPRIAETVLRTVRQAGLRAVRCGAVPTPALALAAMEAGHAAIMVTGSHIPADRNGLKFYVPGGEISKDDEARILTLLESGSVSPQYMPETGAEETGTACLARYAARYVRAFGPQGLAGLRIGIYAHSSVARDVLGQIITALGAETMPLARSDSFIPVDTEAVAPQTRAQLAEWADAHALDAIVSTDGDGDRPMLTDAAGHVIAGDVLGALTARALGAAHLVTPVSSNSQIARMGFVRIDRTRIGSPYVIAQMEAVLARDPAARVAGYEANGGFLLGFTAEGPAGPLAPLMTRDAVLPLVAPLMAAREAGLPLAGLVAALPARFTAADRLTETPPEQSAALLARLTQDAAARVAFFADMGAESEIDLTDGLRITFCSGDIVHLRPSGNAPEFRCYAESDTAARAATLVKRHLARIKQALAAG